MTAKKTAKFDFEGTLKELERIVNAIEQGGVGLAESLELFTKGAKLVKECQQALKTAEQKIKILSGKDLAEFDLSRNDEKQAE